MRNCSFDAVHGYEHALISVIWKETWDKVRGWRFHVQVGVPRGPKTWQNGLWNTWQLPAISSHYTPAYISTCNSRPSYSRVHFHMYKDFRSCYVFIYLQTVFAPIIYEDNSSWKSLYINVDKFASENVHKTLHWALYYLWFQNINELHSTCTLISTFLYFLLLFCISTYSHLISICNHIYISTAIFTFKSLQSSFKISPFPSETF